jgi:hypothetical protein
MSINLIDAAFRRGPANPSHRLVLIALADNANDQGVCWPKLALIARKACVSQRTVIRIIDSLSEEGWITRERRAVKNGKRNGHINRYIVSREKLGLSGDILSLDSESPDNLSRDKLSCESPVEKPKKQRKSCGKAVEKGLQSDTVSRDK